MAKPKSSARKSAKSGAQKRKKYATASPASVLRLKNAGAALQPHPMQAAVDGNLYPSSSQQSTLMIDAFSQNQKCFMEF